MAMSLTICPKREVQEYQGTTGIYIRAKHPETGRYGTYDLYQLDAHSLLRWLRSRGGDNSMAEDVVGVLLGHGHLHPMTDIEKLVETGEDR
jgi:hypothetical protein